MVVSTQGSQSSCYLEFAEYEHHSMSDSGNHPIQLLHFEDMKTDPENEGNGLKVTCIIRGRSGARRSGYLTLRPVLSALPN